MRQLEYNHCSDTQLDSEIIVWTHNGSLDSEICLHTMGLLDSEIIVRTQNGTVSKIIVQTHNGSVRQYNHCTYNGTSSKRIMQF